MPCTLRLPSLETWTFLLLAQALCSFGVGIPLALVLFRTPKPSRRVVGVAVGCAAAVLAALMANRLPADRHWMGSFVASAFGVQAFFKAMAVAFGRHPEGIDEDPRVFVVWFVSMPEPILAKGKLRRPTMRETLAGCRGFAGRIIGLAVLLGGWESLGGGALSEGLGIPGGSWGAAVVDGFFHTWFLYLFLAFCLDFGGLSYSVLFRFAPRPGFGNPLWESRSLRECWAQRWNQPIQLLLQRTVYVPLRKQGWGRALATLATFFVSGLLHEYTFSVHNPGHHQPGTATLFFLFMGVLILAEAAWFRVLPASLSRMAAKVPSPLVASVLLLVVAAGPVELWFIRSWIDAGVLEASRDVFPRLVCGARG